MLARSGHGDVEQTLLFFGVSQPVFSAMYSPARSEICADTKSGQSRRPIEQRFGIGAVSAFDAGLAAGENHDWELQPFRFVNAHDAHRIEIFFGEHAFALILDVEHASVPIGESLP